jgi:acyl dehydratase
MTALLDLDAIRAEFLNKDFDEQTFTVDATKLADYAFACGEQAACYIDPEHPEFQAPPTFPSSLSPGRRLPEGFPELPGMGMDAGKAVAPIKPIRPGTTISAKTHLHDVYAKTGRSGRMTFLVTRMELYNEIGERLATADTRVVIREKPDGND